MLCDLAQITNNNCDGGVGFDSVADENVQLPQMFGEDKHHLCGNVWKRGQGFLDI